MSNFDIESELNTKNLINNLNLVDEELIYSVSNLDINLRRTLLRIINSKSKRLRPMLVLVVANKLKLKFNKKVLNACVAIELIHIASLIHDDIMDSAMTRRGIETINSKEGLNTAILAGDILFAKAGYYASKVNNELSELISNTIINLCKGQASEFEYLYDIKRSSKNYMTAIEGKTCALISASCVAGGICANTDKNTLKLLNDYGTYFGKSFQIIDDMLDFISTKKLLGKPVNNDVIEGVYNLPIIYLLKKTNSIEQENFIKNKYSSKDIVTLLFKHEVFGSLIKDIKKFNKLSFEEMKFLDIKLAELPTKYMSYALNNLISTKYNKSSAFSFKSN